MTCPGNRSSALRDKNLPTRITAVLESRGVEVLSSQLVPPAWNLHTECIGKRYCYYIVDGGTKSGAVQRLSNVAWRPLVDPLGRARLDDQGREQQLDVPAMAAAIKAIKGKHDFRRLSGSTLQPFSPGRRVIRTDGAAGGGGSRPGPFIPVLGRVYPRWRR